MHKKLTNMQELCEYFLNKINNKSLIYGPIFTIQYRNF